MPQKLSYRPAPSVPRVMMCQSPMPYAASPAVTPMRLNTQMATHHESGRVSVPVEQDSGRDLVSLDYANQKLWSVTSEYENLLTVQKEQQDLQLKQKDLEIQALRAELGGKPEARNDAYDKEMAVSLDAKVKELELYASLLQLRDKQIGELQCYIEQKDANGGMQSEMGQATYRETEFNLMRREKENLERLVIAKDKEIHALSSLDPEMSADGALQLGAKAVQLYYESVDHRKVCEQQKADLSAERQENLRLADLVRELECQLKDKRDEMSDIVQQIALKTTRIAELENAVVTSGQEIDEARKQLQHRSSKDADMLDQLERERDTQSHVIAELKNELARRDMLLIERRAEEVAVESEAKILEGKFSEQKQHLESAEVALDKMLAHNNYKDQLVREMTEQINVSETKLHSYQVHELLRTRQRELEQKIREAELREDMNEKDRVLNQLNTELRASQERMNRIRSNLDSYSECDVFESSTRRTSPPREDYSRHTQAHAQDMLHTQTTNDNIERSFDMPGSPQAHAQRQLLDRGESQVRIDQSHEGDKSCFYQSIFGQAYQPYPNDPIDAWIAHFVNDPAHRHLKALFCRLNKGIYLYGTQRVNFQLTQTREGDMVEAYNGNGGWIPLPEFIKHMEPQTSAHMYSGVST